MSAPSLSTDPETLRLARQYHALGWSVVPVSPRSKLPAIAWARYQQTLSTDDEIEGWFSVGGYGIGLVQGATSHSIVLDFDGEQGYETRAALEAEYGPLPHTVEALTPSGGCHVYLQHPGRPVPTRKAVRPGMDIRGDGGFVVAHPSIHANQRRYEWDCDHHPEETTLAPCPAWVAQMVCDEVTAGAASDTAIVHTLHTGPLGLPQETVTDGRETYMRDTVLAVLREQCSLLGRAPGEQELFDAVWPQYSRKVDFTRPGRGASEVHAKCRYTLARLAKGVLPKLSVPKAAPLLPPSPADRGDSLTATPFDPARFATLEPRRWVYGHFLLQRFLAVMGAPGGAGKTAYAMVIGVSVALDKPLLGETVHQHGPVWIYNLEDPEDEIMRRLQAITIQHDIKPTALIGKLYLDSGRDQPLIIAVKTENGTIVAQPIVKELIAELKRRGIRLLIVDPFVKSHRLEENRNEQVDFAVSLWSQVAGEADCSILLLHHFRKGGQSGDADAFRGASALIDGARSAVSLSTMSPKDAERLGIDDADRRFYVRIDNAKLNVAPPPSHAVWIRLNNVALPNGDHVQAATRWEPPSLWEGVPMILVVRVLDIISSGKGGEQFTLKSNSADKARWAGQVIVEEIGQTEAQARDMLAAWVKSGLLQETRYYSTNRRKEITGCTVNTRTVSEMRQTLRADSDE